MIVTIDGPAGAGKSSASRGLAQRLGFLFLDTGAMYRAVAFAAHEAGVDLEDEQALANFARGLRIEMTDDRVLLDGRDVTKDIRTMAITDLTRHSAANPGVRAHLVVQQRAIAAGKSVVTEGRDQGTVAFPDAE
ncbi:MAG: (d)CMP kinase, partial [Planctomycetales bacterium]|nr:(d)CMP kinase [Planctomycetales bacterium]